MQGNTNLTEKSVWKIIYFRSLPVQGMSTAFGDRVAETGRTIDSTSLFPFFILSNQPVRRAVFQGEEKRLFNMEWYNINPDTAKKKPFK
jgi:hypothetical protein